jgi:hypothetical protein
MLVDTLTSQRSRERGIFKPSEVSKWIRELDEGHRDRSLHLWALLNFEVWASTYA